MIAVLLLPVPRTRAGAGAGAGSTTAKEGGRSSLAPFTDPELATPLSAAATAGDPRLG